MAQPYSSAPISDAAQQQSVVMGVALSREELLVLLRLLKTRSIPGFDPAWAYSADDALTADAKASLEPAISALVARGLMQVQDDARGEREEAIVSPVVVALVGASARSAMTVRLHCSSSGEISEFYLHEFQGLGVLHTVVSERIHAFLPLEGRADVIQVILATVGVGVDAPHTASPIQTGMSLTHEVFQDALSAAAKADEFRVQTCLATSTMGPATLAALTRSLMAQQQYSEVSVAVRSAHGEIVRQSAICLVSQAYAWAFTVAGEQDDLQSLGPDAAIGLLRWLEMALTTQE